MLSFNAITAVALALLISSQPATAEVQKVTIKIVSSPDAGKVRTVSVGSAIYEKSRSALIEEAVTTVAEPMKGGLLFLAPTIRPDQPLTPVDSKAKFKACTEGGSGPCGLDDDGDGIFDRMAKDDDSVALKLKTPTRYVTRATSRIVEDPDNFRQTILYSGATSDTLRLSYREFMKDMARPAFTEELSIPLGKTYPQDVAVKDLVMRVHSISGMGLKYEVLPSSMAERG